jgi:hypothetical protein
VRAHAAHAGSIRASNECFLAYGRGAFGANRHPQLS